jgi:phenylalanyl-tRNA synthetase alpha subunit
VRAIRASAPRLLAKQWGSGSVPPAGSERARERGEAIPPRASILEQLERADLRSVYETGISAIDEAADLQALEDVRVRFLGRKAELTGLLRSIPELPADERPAVGRFGNLVKRELETALEQRRLFLEEVELVQDLEADQVDITLPGYPFPEGHLHLITSTRRDVEDIFIGMGTRPRCRCA